MNRITILILAVFLLLTVAFAIAKLVNRSNTPKYAELHKMESATTSVTISGNRMLPTEILLKENTKYRLLFPENCQPNQRRPSISWNGFEDGTGVEIEVLCSPTGETN